MLLLFSTEDVHLQLLPAISHLEHARNVYTFSLRLPIYSALESLLCDPFSMDPLPFNDPAFLGSSVPGRAGHVTYEVLIGELTDWVEESLYPNHLSSQLATSVEYAFVDGVSEIFLLTHIRDMRDVVSVYEQLHECSPTCVLLADAHSLFMSPQHQGFQFTKTITIETSATPETIFNEISAVISKYDDHEQRAED